MLVQIKGVLPPRIAKGAAAIVARIEDGVPKRSRATVTPPSPRSMASARRTASSQSSTRLACIAGPSCSRRSRA
jgi:hypothetical protein